MVWWVFCYQLDHFGPYSHLSNLYPILNMNINSYISNLYPMLTMIHFSHQITCSGRQTASLPDISPFISHYNLSFHMDMICQYASPTLQLLYAPPGLGSKQLQIFPPRQHSMRQYNPLQSPTLWQGQLPAKHSFSHFISPYKLNIGFLLPSLECAMFLHVDGIQCDNFCPVPFEAYE
jgi:hypothetical protein